MLHSPCLTGKSGVLLIFVSEHVMSSLVIDKLFSLLLVLFSGYNVPWCVCMCVLKIFFLLCVHYF